MIPKNIFQIYHDKSIVPDHVKHHILKLNPGYNYQLINFEEGKQIIKNNFNEPESNIICNTIDRVPRYCHKSDLLRYCLLYIYGGIYIDCDLKPLVPFNCFTDNNFTFLTSFGLGPNYGTFEYRFNGQIKAGHKIMANGICATSKNNLLLPHLIKYCVNNPIDSHPDNRGQNVAHLYNMLNSKSQKPIIPFQKINIDNESIYLIIQDSNNCKYGTNCFINEHNETLITPNDNDYDFERQTSSYV